MKKIIFLAVIVLTTTSCLKPGLSKLDKDLYKANLELQSRLIGLKLKTGSQQVQAVNLDSKALSSSGVPTKMLHCLKQEMRNKTPFYEAHGSCKAASN